MSQLYPSIGEFPILQSAFFVRRFEGFWCEGGLLESLDDVSSSASEPFLSIVSLVFLIAIFFLGGVVFLEESKWHVKKKYELDPPKYFTKRINTSKNESFFGLTYSHLIFC